MADFDIAIIGAGPAGLMAAETLASLGCTVTIYEKMPSAARKFLMAGRGGLNLTHSEPLEKFLVRYGPARDWLTSHIEAFSPDMLKAWAEGLGEGVFIGSSGRVFPASFKASPLLRAWLRRLSEQGVTLRTRAAWQGWNEAGDLVFADGSTVRPDATVLALGGASWPRLGSDGGWVRLLQEKQISINALRPFNAGVNVAWSQHTASKFAGAPLKGIALTCGGVCVRAEAIVTQSGLEGGAVYALSREILQALDTPPAELLLDLKPDLSTGALADRLAKIDAKQSLTNRLRKGAGLTPAAISVWRDLTLQIPDSDAALAQSLKHVKVPVSGMQPLERAISTSGGIALEELDADLMLLKLPGVFACGEMLDWDAPTGGYLLQACMATGRAAGEGAFAFVSSRA